MSRIKCVHCFRYHCTHVGISREFDCCCWCGGRRKDIEKRREKMKLLKRIVFRLAKIMTRTGRALREWSCE